MLTTNFNAIILKGNILKKSYIEATMLKATTLKNIYIESIIGLRHISCNSTHYRFEMIMFAILVSFDVICIVKFSIQLFALLSS